MSSADSSFQSDQSDQSKNYAVKIQKTNELISHLESKLQSYMKPKNSFMQQSEQNNTNILLSQMKHQISDLSSEKSDSNLLNQPHSSFYQKRYQQHDTSSISKVTREEQTHLKSKQELEREMREFDERMQRFNTYDLSQPTFPSVQKTQRSQEMSIPIDNMIRIENQTQSDMKSDRSSNIIKQQEAILQNINQKILQLQRQDDDQVYQIESQIKQMEQNQMQLLEDRNQLLEERNELQAVFNDLQLEHQEIIRKVLKDDERLILADQKQKINQIISQSDDLIRDQMEKKQHVDIKIQQLISENQEILIDIQREEEQAEAVYNQKEDLTQQLNSLIVLHNQMLQTDLKKTLLTIQNTPQSSEEGSRIRSSRQNKNHESESKQLATQIEFLYKLNLQLKETMETQLQDIRYELNEQRTINQELLNMMRSKTEENTLQIMNTNNVTGLELPMIQKYSPNQTSKQAGKQLDLKTIKLESFDQLYSQLKTKHKVKANNRLKSISATKLSNTNIKSRTQIKSRVANQTFQDQILQLNELVADQLNQIKI